MKINNSTSQRERHDRINVSVALISLFLGWSLTIAAFIIEPQGEVHDSVLWILGQSLTFAGSLLGAKSYIDFRTAQEQQETT